MAQTCGAEIFPCGGHRPIYPAYIHHGCWWPGNTMSQGISSHGWTHWGRVTYHQSIQNCIMFLPLELYQEVYVCVGDFTIIGWINGLSPGRRQAIIWTNAGILLIGPIGTNFNEIFFEIQKFSYKKMNLEMSSATWWPFCLGLHVLNWFSRNIPVSALEGLITYIIIIEIHAGSILIQWTWQHTWLYYAINIKCVLPLNQVTLFMIFNKFKSGYCSKWTVIKIIRSNDYMWRQLGA